MLNTYCFGVGTDKSPAIANFNMPVYGNPKNILGGKGANLMEMHSKGFNVPPGFIIPTSYCMEFLDINGKDAKKQFLGSLKETLEANIAWLNSAYQYNYSPLVSVRSGARVSMPGMMDTILNVGITDKNLNAWCGRIGEVAAKDSYRRLIQMFGNVVKGIDMSEFDLIYDSVKEIEGVEKDSDLSGCALDEIIDRFKAVYKKHTKANFPQTVMKQIQDATLAVFRSWNSDRAIEYRKINGYPDDWGTAVTVQSMVFGNLNDDSATGVIFSRCPSTGIELIVGEYLVNAQGEDVVAGIRTPEHFSKIGFWNPDVMDSLVNSAKSLENHYRDMQDIEFTVQDGEVYILQTRNAKRSARAAVRVATDMYKEALITLDEVKKRVTLSQFLTSMQATVDSKFTLPADYIGIAAGGCVVRGVAVTSSDAAVASDEPCILVSAETTPDDIAGMNASIGILTSTGGLTSHAAVVARGMDKTCVVGCADLIDFNAIDGHTITIDGSTGKVWVDVDVPIITGGLEPELVKFALDELIDPDSPIYLGRESDPIGAYDRVLIELEDYDISSSKLYVDLIDKIDDAFKKGASHIYLDLRHRLFDDYKHGYMDFIVQRFHSNGYANDFYEGFLAELQHGFGPELLQRITVVNAIEEGVHCRKDWYMSDINTVIGVSNVQDIYNSGGTFAISDDTIDKVFGSKETYDKIISLMASEGFEVKATKEGSKVFTTLYNFFATAS